MVATVTYPTFKVVNVGISSVDADNKDNHDIRVTPVFDIINSIYFGYRQCYSAGTVKDLEKTKPELVDEYYVSLAKSRRPATAQAWKDALQEYDPNGEQIAKMVTKAKFIAEHINHISQLEHSAITLSISNLSRACSTQFIRHRMAAYGIQSQRYVAWNKGDMASVTMPPTIARNPEARAIFEDYLEYMESCVQKLTDLGIRNEDIRYIYPEGTDTRQIATMNLHSWIHFISERACTKAQWEIRHIANDLLAIFKVIFPFVFDNLGPKCYHLKYCPETKSCPIIKKVIQSNTTSI